MKHFFERKDESVKQNNWKNIWEKRDDRLSHINLSDTKEVFLELKRLDGYDIADGGIPYDDLLKQYQITSKHLGINSPGGGIRQRI